MTPTHLAETLVSQQRQALSHRTATPRPGRSVRRPRRNLRTNVGLSLVRLGLHLTEPLAVDIIPHPR